MTKVIEVREALVECEKKLTVQVKRRSNRDRVKIRELQVEHAKLTNSLAALLKDNREETVDKTDDTGETFRAEQEEKQTEKRHEFEKKLIAQREAQRREDLNLENNSNQNKHKKN